MFRFFLLTILFNRVVCQSVSNVPIVIHLWHCLFASNSFLVFWSRRFIFDIWAGYFSGVDFCYCTIFEFRESAKTTPHAIEKCQCIEKGLVLSLYIQRKYKFRCKNNKCAIVYIASKLNLLNEEVKKISISIALCTEIDHEISQCTTVCLGCICCSNL